jgi:hypothetical protein
LVTRRLALRALAAAPAGLLAAPADAADYTRAADVFATIESLSQTVEARLRALGEARPRAAAFVSAARADILRHRRERQALTERRRVAVGAMPPAAPEPVDEPRSLPRLRSLLEELMHVHAEGLPALRDPALVQGLAPHMTDLSRHVTVVDLWIETESPDE